MNYSDDLTIYELLAIVGSKKRVDLLKNLQDKPQNLTSLAKKLQISPQEVRRYLVRLAEMGLIAKNDGEYTLSLMGNFFLQIFKLVARNFHGLKMISRSDAQIPCLRCLDLNSLTLNKELGEENSLIEADSSLRCTGLCPIFFMLSHALHGFFNVIYFMHRIVLTSKRYVKIAISGAELFPFFYPKDVRVQILLDMNQKDFVFLLNTLNDSSVWDIRVYGENLPFNTVINEREALLLPVNSAGSLIGDIGFHVIHPILKHSCDRLFDEYFRKSVSFNNVPKNLT